MQTENGRPPTAVYYKVQRDSLRDWKTVNGQELDDLARNISSEFNVNLVTEAGISAVYELIRNAVFASNPETMGSKELKDELSARIDRLRSLIRRFLGTELTWDQRGDPHLFGLPIGRANLSEGQKVLLQVALSLFFQDGTQEDLVLLLDEPENHLHPSALIQLVDEVRAVCGQAQIWIATHSISLIAHYDPSQLWLVQDGQAMRAGSKSLDLLDALLGHESGMEELATLLALPARQAAVHFAAQCLLPPEVADTPPGDPQTRQIAAVVRSLSGEQPLRVLDFGAGSGRLIVELEAASSLNGSVDYWAWDVETAPGTQYKEKLKEINGDSSRFRQGQGSLDDLGGTIDLVVMCNSLHEIPPHEWPAIFGVDGPVAKLLKPGAHLLIVEDQLLSFGERAHASGFHVLDAQQLRYLFDMDERDGRLRTFGHSDPVTPTV